MGYGFTRIDSFLFIDYKQDFFYNELQKMYSRNLSMSNPVLSIITVCYNAHDELKKTLENVLSQTWENFEYRIVDGGSKDETLRLLTDYAARFEQKGISFQYTSEPDRGIYDAMNKGSRLVRGSYLLFLNAGDVLVGNDLLEKVFSDTQTADILYGDALCSYQGRQRLYPALPLEHLTYEMAFCHQSAFIKRDLMLAHPYDITYKVCADHELALYAYINKKTFLYLPYPICVYEIAGYSDKNLLRAHKEQQRMQRELGVFRYSTRWLKNEAVFYCKQGLKAVFGQKLIDFVRRLYLHD